MQTKASGFSKHYQTALGQYLQVSSAGNMRHAHSLGLQAARNRLETLELAKIHETALLTLLLPGQKQRTRDALIRRASAFFAEAITPIEETRPGAKLAGIRLRAVIQSLSRRGVELATSNKKLEEEILQRRAVEVSLRTSEQTTSKLLEKSRELQEELRLLSRRLLSAQEEERKRISRELHDVIAQTLAGITLRLAALKTLSSTNSRDLHKRIAQTQRLVEKSVDIVHRFARDLRPTMLDDLGLVPAFQSYLKGFIEQTGVRVELSASSGVEKLDSVCRTALYRVAQEALTNIARHARASQASVSIREKNGALHMEIWDNGKGFQVEGNASAKKNKRLGLLGMRERMEMIGGTFSLESAPGRETTISVVIPKDRIKQPAPQNSR